MGKHNSITVKSYNDEHQAYVDNTAAETTETIKIFLNAFLSQLATGTKILEIGSGTGRDAEYIEDAGYKILRTDAAENFVKYMRAQGHTAKVLDIVNERLPEQFDAILANAVFVHFDDEEFDAAITNIKQMLKPGGIFGISLHNGSFRGIIDHKLSARYFQEWTKADICSYLTGHDFEIISVLDGISVSKRKAWVNLIVSYGAEG